MNQEQKEILIELAKIMKAQGIASGGSGFSYYDESSKLGFSFRPEDMKQTLATLDKQFKATAKKLKSNNDNLDKLIKRTTERTFDNIINRVTRSLPTRNNIIRRMDEVFDDLEDSVDEFDKALGASTKRLLREFNGNLNELSKVKRSFGALVQDFNKYSTQLGEKPSRNAISTMADNIAGKIQELEANGLKELSETLKPTLDAIRKILAESKDRVITDTEMDTLRKTILENLPKMAKTDEKLTNLFGQYMASQKEQTADFANTMKGAVALIGNDIRRLPGFITSEATNFQGGGMSPSNWLTAFTQGMSPQDYNQMQLRYMVLQARGQEAFNSSINDINANLRNDYGLVGEQQTQMRNVLLDISKNLGAVDNAGFSGQVNSLTKVIEGIAQREGASMQDAAGMMLDISNESYIQTRLIGKTTQEQIDVLTDELDTRSRLNKQLGINFEMQKQLNRDQRSKMFGGYAEKLAGGIRAEMAARMMGASQEDARTIRQYQMGAFDNDAEGLARSQQALQTIMPAFEQGKREESLTGRLGTAGVVQMVGGSDLFGMQTVDTINSQILAAQQLRNTTASGQNSAFIGATGTGTNDAANAKPGLDAPSIATMYVKELIYAAGASPLGSVLGGVAGTLLELAQTALLLRMGGGLGGGLGRAGGLASSAAGALRNTASGVAGRVGGAVAARGGMAALGVGAAGLAGAGYAAYAGFGNTMQMFNPETEGKTREEVTSAQVTGTMKNLAIVAGGAIGLLGGPVGVAIGAGAGALVGELGEAVSDYIPDWAKMLTPLGQISMGLERGINQWKELTDVQGNYAEIDRIKAGVKDGTMMINDETIQRFADLSDHTDGFWGGSTYTSSAELESARNKLNAIYAVESGKIVGEDGKLMDADTATGELLEEIIRLREVAENHRDIDMEQGAQQLDMNKQSLLESRRQNEVRDARTKMMDSINERFDISGAFNSVSLG